MSSDKRRKDKTSEIWQLDKSVNTDANKVAVSSLLLRKKKINNMVKEAETSSIYMSNNNLSLFSNSNINPKHIVKDLQLNGYIDQQLTKNFIRFIKNS